MKIIPRRPVGLLLIAVGCVLVTAFFFQLPQWLTLGGEAGGAGARLLKEFPSLLAFDRAEESATDFLQVYGRKADLDPQIVFLAIDSFSFDPKNFPAEERGDPALQMMSGAFPFPRAIYPLIIRRLADAGARVIMFDIMFPAPKEGDETFAEALQLYGEKVVIGSNLQIGLQVNGGASGVITAPSPSLIPGDDSLFDPRVGYINFKPDYETVRRAQYRANILEYFDEPPETLGQNAESGGRELLSLTAQGAKKAGFAERIPEGTARLPFRFLENPQPRSIADIFVPSVWQKNYANGEFFRDKLVFIGPYGNWSKDELQTPFGPRLGPEIHLAALHALLTGQYLHFTSHGTDVLFLLIAGAGAFAAGLWIVHPILRSFALLGLVALYVGLAFFAFNSGGHVPALLSPSLALLSSGFLGLVWEQVLERQEKTRVRQTLERYVSKDVVKEVLDNPQSFLLTQGGMRKPVTVLFSDIRGFTALTESADATQLVLQLNEYFTQMVRIVFANRGTLDKFIGDAVMAHWGAIVSRGEGPDACRAVATALDMQKSVAKLNVGWRERGMPELRIGLGINHGYAICANIGSDEKYEMTAIGDAVNLASRLEGATKVFHQDLLIGEMVAPLVSEHYLLRPVHLLRVMGKTKPVEVFAVLGARSEMADPAWLAPYEEGVRLFRQREFSEAKLRFEAVLAEKPDDWLATEYRSRCAEFEATPPDGDWDGSYVMSRK